MFQEGLFLNDLYEISFSVSSDPTADSDSTEITASFKLLNAGRPASPKFDMSAKI